MQMFGIGILELMVIMVLAVLVIGPDRLPAFAADLAQWIRKARAYGTHLTRDFNEVMKDFEKEAGASREDWKEIAGVFNRSTGNVTKDLQSVLDKIEQSDSTASKESANGATAAPPPIVPEESVPAEEDVSGEEKPWYVPEKTTRRRPRS